MDQGKNPSEFYDLKYLKGRMSMEDLPSVRWEDNGLFYHAAVFAKNISSTFTSRKILDIGCGRGFLVNHLRNLGLEADGIEYGKAALEHSVCGAVFGDLTDKLPIADLHYDFSICHGVMSHISESFIPHAISEIRRVTQYALWLNVLTKWHPTQAHHRTFHEGSWWKERFTENGWAHMDPFDGALKENGFNQERSLQYSAIFSPYV